MILDKLDLELAKRIMKHQNINFSNLARKYGVDRHTISRHYLRIKNGPTVRKRRKSLIADYEAEIKEKLEDGDSIKSIYMSLLNRTSFDSLKSYSNFKQYVNRWYFDSKVEGKHLVPKYRYETPPGEQLQFDWVEDIKLHLTNGELVTFNLWSATLGYSRYHYFKVAENLTEAEMKNCFISTIINLGGVPKTVLTDNMSAIVSIRDGKKHVHPTVTQFFKDMGVKLNLCKARHAYTKGKVEVSNKYQNRLDPYDGKFSSKNDLYNGVEEILNQSNYQINSELKVTPSFLFKKEKGTLNSLPNINVLKSYLNNVIERTVNISSLIEYKGAKYGVPKEYINKKVLIRETEKNIYIYDIGLNSISTYEKQTSGIHYANGLYEIAKMQNESLEAFKIRIDDNLNRLAKLQEIKNERIY